jgi:alkylhydroperoxidase family enzyme
VLHVDPQAAELTAQVTELRQQLQEQQDKATAAALKQANNHEQQLQQLQQRLQEAVSKAAAQHEEAQEAAAQLTELLRQAERQMDLTAAERDALQVRAAGQAALCCNLLKTSSS